MKRYNILMTMAVIASLAASSVQAQSQSDTNKQNKATTIQTQIEESQKMMIDNTINHESKYNCAQHA